MFAEDFQFAEFEESTGRERVETRILFFTLPSIPFIELVRGQICEVNLLQLSPSDYLFLLILSAIFLTSCASFFLAIPIGLDGRRQIGGKTLGKFNLFFLRKISLSLVFYTLFLSLNLIIPLGLDSFNSYADSYLEQFWSFGEVIGLEMILLTILMSLSQVPIAFVVTSYNERRKKKLSASFRYIVFYIFLASGVLTPSKDAYTQISFAVSALLLFSFILLYILKRTRVRSSLQQALR